MTRRNPMSLTKLAVHACFDRIFSSESFTLFRRCLAEYDDIEEDEASLPKFKSKVKRMRIIDKVKDTMKYWRKQFDLLKEERVIGECLRKRLNCVDSKSIEILLHMLTRNDTVTVCWGHMTILHFLIDMRFPLNLIKEELIDDVMYEDWYFQYLFQNLNGLKHIEMAHIRLETFDIIRQKYSKTLESLVFRMSIVGGNHAAINNKYCQFLFRDKSLKEVRECYVNCKTVELSFPQLKQLRLSLNENGDHYDLLRFVLHYYPKVNLLWPTNMRACIVSPFEGVLSYTIDFNPDHAVERCELLFEDLKLSYVDEVLMKWNKLTSLIISLRKIPSDFDIEYASKKLSKILNKCTQISSIKLVILTSGVIPQFEICNKYLREHGKKMTKFMVSDQIGVLNWKQICESINCFSNLYELNIIIKKKCGSFKPYLKEQKELKILRFFCLNQDASFSDQFVKLMLDSSPSLVEFFTNHLSNRLRPYFVKKLIFRVDSYSILHRIEEICFTTKVEELVIVIPPEVVRSVSKEIRIDCKFDELLPMNYTRRIAEYIVPKVIKDHGPVQFRQNEISIEFPKFLSLY